MILVGFGAAERSFEGHERRDGVLEVVAAAVAMTDGRERREKRVAFVCSKASGVGSSRLIHPGGRKLWTGSWERQPQKSTQLPAHKRAQSFYDYWTGMNIGIMMSLVQVDPMSRITILICSMAP